MKSTYILMLITCFLLSTRVIHASDDSPTNLPTSKLSILLDVPVDTARDSEIYITGDFEQWSGGATKREKYRAHYVSPGRFEVQIAGKPGDSIEFKFTQGSWARSEMAANGDESENRSYRFMTTDEQITETIDAWAKFHENAVIDSTPADRKDGLFVGELGKDSGNEALLLKLATEISDASHGGIDSLLIAHKGRFIFESYYRRGSIDLPHPQASATKSYTGFALGRAIQLGYLTMADLDKPLIQFLKDLNPTNFVEGAERITLKHALTMTTGIRISDEKREKWEKKPNQLKGQGYVQTQLEDTLPITKESQIFSYGTGPDLVMQVIEAVVPGTAKDFIKDEVLGKLGITNYRWRTNETTGLPESGWRTSLTPRDMLKFGTLAMNGGKWNGEQLIPKAFINDAISRILLTGDDDIHFGGKDVSNQGYGYFWWSADLKHRDKSYFAASAQGGGGQLIILIKELDLLLVITGRDNNVNYLQMVAKRILPAFT